jgi:glycosyltransferase involved in cell wall biosynthesis
VKIFAWPGSVGDGCFEYRIQMPLRELAEQRGHEVQVSQQMNAWAREEADIIVGQRVALNPPSVLWQTLADPKLRSREHHLVFELDDDLWAIDPRHNRFAEVFKRPGVADNLRDNIRAADLVTVSTDVLASVVSKYNPNVRILPNCVDESVLAIPVPLFRRNPDYPLITLGWQGSPTHHEDWKIVQPVVAEIMHANPHVRMRFLGTDYPEGLPPQQVDFEMWTKDLGLHHKRVSKFHIGLAPLVDTTFNRSKSGLRAIEYAALGVPVVATDCPAYRPWVRSGVTGYLCRTRDDWMDALTTLIADAEARRVMGVDARLVARRWTIQANAHLWEDAYASIL